MFLRHLRGLLRVGPREYLRQVWHFREFRGGTLVGSDQYGNKYYELQDPELPFYRKRYVDIPDGEPSCVPAEWHGWLHYTNDDAPNRSSSYVYPAWGVPHRENLTGTADRYVPYSTTDRKVLPYSPPNMNMALAFRLGNPALTGSGVKSLLDSTVKIAESPSQARQTVMDHK